MSTVELTREAEADAEEIWQFIAKDGVARADKMIGQIWKNVQTLLDHPFAGRDRKAFSAGLRSLAVPPYVVFYRPTTTGVLVVRILHGSMDITRDDFADEA